MSRRSVQRFCDYDMREIKELKRVKRILEIATRFRTGSGCDCPWRDQAQRDGSAL